MILNRVDFVTWTAITLLVSLCVSAQSYGQGNAVTVSVGTGISTTQLTESNTSTQVLHAQVDGSGNLPGPSGYAELWYAPGTPGGRSELSVAIKETRRSGRIYAENRSVTQVGVAFSNPNTQDVMLSFFFTDANGVNLGDGSTTIPANGEIAAFLSESPFNAPQAFQGTFTYNASAPVAALAVRGYVNEMGLFLMPQLPVAEIAGPSTTVVPYFANGSGCAITLFDCKNIRAATTELILVNPTDSALSGVFTFVGEGAPDSAAPPAAVTIDGQTSAVFEYSLPPRTSRRFTTAGRADSFENGSIQITPAQGRPGPIAFAILSFQSDGSPIRYQTTVVGQAPAPAFRLPVRGFRFGGIFAGFTTSTGIVITNPSSTPVGVSVDMRSRNASTTLSVPARGQIVVTPQSDLQLSEGYSGVVRISSSSPISVVGLQQFINQYYGALAVEAFDESIPTPVEPVFPHLAVGNYRTTLLLFKTSDGQASTATIRFIAPSGLPADPRDFGFRE